MVTLQVRDLVLRGLFPYAEMTHKHTDRHTVTLVVIKMTENNARAHTQTHTHTLIVP